MKVTNDTSFTIIAFCWDAKVGYGDDTPITRGKSVNVMGPYLGNMGDGSCYVIIEGTIICQESKDDNNGFHVSIGNQLNLQKGAKGITIRHYLEDRKL